MSSWTDYLPSDVSERLGMCCNTREDIPILVNAKWKKMKEQGKDKIGYTKEDALIQVLEHLDCNSQDFDLTIDEYNEFKR